MSRPRLTAAPAAMAVVGVALLGFGVWGTRTAAGMRSFTGPAALAPLLAGALGVLLLLAAAVARALGKRPPD